MHQVVKERGRRTLVGGGWSDIVDILLVDLVVAVTKELKACAEARGFRVPRGEGRRLPDIGSSDAVALAYVGFAVVYGSDDKLFCPQVARLISRFATASKVQRRSHYRRRSPVGSLLPSRGERRRADQPGSRGKEEKNRPTGVHGGRGQLG